MDATRSGKKNVPKRARAHTQIAYLLILSLTSFVRIYPCCEKNALAASFPPDALNVSNSSVVHRSMFALFTAEMCTPSDRCTPEQSRHTNTQNVFDVHFGLGVLQSKHSLFPFLRKSALNSASRSCCVAIFFFVFFVSSLSLVSLLFCAKAKTHTHTHTHTQHTLWESRSDARFFSRVKMGWVGPLSFQTHAYYSLGFFSFFGKKKKAIPFALFFFSFFYSLLRARIE